MLRAKAIVLCCLLVVLCPVGVSAMKCADAIWVRDTLDMAVEADTTWLRTTVDKLPLSVIYYPDTAFGPLPTAYMDFNCTTGSALPMDLARTLLFADCRMQYVFTQPDTLLSRLQTLSPATEVLIAVCAWEKANITVIPTMPVPVANLTLTPDTIYLSAQHTQDTIRAKVLPDDADNKAIRWSLVNNADADGNVLITMGEWSDSVVVGMLSPTRGGTVKVAATATDGSDVSDTAYVIVPNTTKVTKITLSTSNGEAPILDSNQRSLSFVADVQPDYAMDKSLTWTMLGDTASLAVWDEKTHTLTAKENGDGGELKVVATANDGSEAADTLVITVRPTLVLATGIAVSPKIVQLTATAPAQTFSVALVPTNVKNKDVEWRVAEGADLITWDATTCTATMVMNTQGGTAKIAVSTKDGTDLSDTAVITIPNTAEVTKVTLSTANGEAPILDSNQHNLTIVADVQPDYAVDKSLTWTVSGDTASLAVWNEATHTLTAKENGNGGELKVVATANDGSQAADTMVITVRPMFVPVERIAIAPETAQLTAATPQETFTVSITPANAKMQAVVWTLLNNQDAYGNTLVDTVTTQVTETMPSSCVVSMRGASAGGKVHLVATTTDGTLLSDTAVIEVQMDTADMRMWIEVEESDTDDDSYTLYSPDTIHIMAQFEPTFIRPRVLSYSITQGKHLIALDKTTDRTGGLAVSTLPKNVGGDAVLQGTAEVEGNTVTATLRLHIVPETTDVDDVWGRDGTPQRRLVLYEGVIYIEVRTQDGVEWYTMQGQKVR